MTPKRLVGFGASGPGGAPPERDGLAVTAPLRRRVPACAGSETD
jgi:hypothetical protein